LTRTYSTDTFTPCYRAPEVVITPGRYSEAVDTWALGCIFFELLQRLPEYAATPCRRLFAGASDDRAMIIEVLETIGSPCHGAIDDLLSQDGRNENSGEWSAWLKALPIKPGSLTKQCLHRSPPVELEIFDFIYRFLAFSPSHRCSAKEALGHSFLSSEPIPDRLELERSSVAVELSALEAALEAAMGEVTWDAVALKMLQDEVDGFQSRSLKMLKEAERRPEVGVKQARGQGKAVLKKTRPEILIHTSAPTQVVSAC